MSILSKFPEKNASTTRNKGQKVEIICKTNKKSFRRTNRIKIVLLILYVLFENIITDLIRF